MEDFFEKQFNKIEKEVCSENSTQAIVVRLSDIQSEPISWLWQGRIALGKLTLIVGDPGLGKSLLTATLAAIVSKGYSFPVDNTKAPMGDVVLLSAEDDAADTIKPRLEAAEADCARIHILKAVQEVDDAGKQTERMFSLKNDIAILEKLLPSIPDCCLLIIDPISAYLNDTDSHNNSDIRGLLAPLAALATRYKIAIIAVSHLNKGSGGNALYRAMGSLAFVAAARAAYVVTKDEHNPQRRLFLPVKNNLAQDTTGLAYTVVTAPNGAPVMAWEPDPIVITADEALVPIEPNEEHTATDEAISFLRDILSSGSTVASQVQKEARQAGISEKSLRRGREKLGIKPKKSAFNGGWEWSLTEDAPSSQDAHPETEGTLGGVGHLRGEELEDKEAQESIFADDG
ncbi:MAG TPA: AAA family ATPase [Candidatus Paceibacterota bacterium]